MKIGFRQGLIKVPASGCLSLSGNQVSINSSEGVLIASAAHKSENYLIDSITSVSLTNPAKTRILGTHADPDHTFITFSDLSNQC